MLRHDLVVRMAFLRVWRVAHALHRRGWRRGARALALVVRAVWSVDIPPSTVLPNDVIFMHNGLGVVLHPATVFTGPAVVFQHVTLGDSFRPRDEQVAPVIGARVVIGAGAMVLGPVKVGDDCVIGAGAVVTRDVPANSIVAGHAPSVREREDDALTQRWFEPGT